MIGGGLICVSIAFGNYVDFITFFILWLIAGFSQTLAEMPSQILIAEKIPKEEHGKFTELTLHGAIFGGHLLILLLVLQVLILEAKNF